MYLVRCELMSRTCCIHSGTGTEQTLFNYMYYPCPPATAAVTYHLLEFGPQHGHLADFLANSLRLFGLLALQPISLFVQCVFLGLDGLEVTLKAAETTLQRDDARQVAAELVRRLDELRLLAYPRLRLLHFHVPVVHLCRTQHVYMYSVHEADEMLPQRPHCPKYP